MRVKEGKRGKEKRKMTKNEKQSKKKGVFLSEKKEKERKM